MFGGYTRNVLNVKSIYVRLYSVHFAYMNPGRVHFVARILSYYGLVVDVGNIKVLN